MKHLLLLFITLAFLAISANAAVACQCGMYGAPICSQYWRSDAVFVGQVRDITLPDPKAKDSESVATLHLIVEQRFRGITKAIVDVGTLYGTSCDMKFKKGARYLIYANGSESDRLYTGLCTGTTELQHAEEDLAYIRSLMQQGVAESISGRVAIHRHEPVPGAKILISKDNKTFEATADSEGDFSVSVAAPGTYKVRVQVPASVSALSTQDEPVDNVETTDVATTIEYKVELKKNQCDHRQLEIYRVDLHATAEISGTVVNPSGQPVGNVFVRLLTAADSQYYDMEQTKADGSFNFRGVAVGEYFLAVNPENEAPGKDDPPYGSAYYPNATKDRDAAKIVVTEGARLENLTLHVGPPWKSRRVSGKVVWRNGSPAANVFLSLKAGGRHVRMLEVDEKGRFSFDAYGDFVYVLEARTFDSSGQSGAVTVDDKTTNLKVVLNPK